MKLVAEGNTAKEIARLMDIAPRTTERHLENIRRKAAAKNVTHLAVVALRRGWIN